MRCRQWKSPHIATLHSATVQVLLPSLLSGICREQDHAPAAPFLKLHCTCCPTMSLLRGVEANERILLLQRQVQTPWRWFLLKWGVVCSAWQESESQRRVVDGSFALSITLSLWLFTAFTFQSCYPLNVWEELRITSQKNKAVEQSVVTLFISQTFLTTHSSLKEIFFSLSRSLLDGNWIF